MPLFTTSRKPCARVRSLVKELVRMVPGSDAMARGKQSVDEVAEKARQMGFPIVAVITEMHGNPASIRFLSVDDAGWEWGKQIPLKSVKLARDFGRCKKPDALRLDDEIGFAKLLGVEAEESDTMLTAKKDAVTFLQNGEEVGPRLSIRTEKHEPRNRGGRRRPKKG
ncbi:hypothetical protein ACFLQ2_01955 [archaeon]